MSSRVLAGAARAAASREEIGGKAANLSELEAAGLSVPAWVVGVKGLLASVRDHDTVELDGSTGEVRILT